VWTVFAPGLSCSCPSRVHARAHSPLPRTAVRPRSRAHGARQPRRPGPGRQPPRRHRGQVRGEGLRGGPPAVILDHRGRSRQGLPGRRPSVPRSAAGAPLPVLPGPKAPPQRPDVRGRSPGSQGQSHVLPRPQPGAGGVSLHQACAQAGGGPRPGHLQPPPAPGANGGAGARGGAGPGRAPAAVGGAARPRAAPGRAAAGPGGTAYQPSSG